MEEQSTRGQEVEEQTTQGQEGARPFSLTDETLLAGERRRNRRILLIHVFSIALVLIALLCWRWFWPLPAMYVAIAQPELQEGLPPELGAALRLALFDNVSLLRNTYALRLEEVDRGGGNTTEDIAYAVDAHEVITCRVTRKGRKGRLEICRTYSLTRLTAALEFDVEPMTAEAVSAVVGANLFELYRERKPGLRWPRQADYTSFAEIWLGLAEETDLRQALEDLATLRAEGNCPIEAYRAEISTACRLYSNSGEKKQLDLASQVLSQAPKTDSVIHAAVGLALTTGDTERAQKLLDRVSDDHPDNWWHQQAIYEATGNSPRAATVIYQIVLDRESWYHYWVLGQIELKAGDFEVARWAFRKTLARTTGNLTVLHAAADLELKTGWLDRAKDHYLDLFGPDQKPEYLEKIGVIQLLYGEYQEAARTFQKKLDLGLEEVSTLANLADSYWLMQDGRAEETYQRVIDRAAGATDAHSMALRARALAYQGKKAEASESLNHALDQQRSPEILYLAAVAYSRLGDDSKAKQLATEAADLGWSDHWFDQPWFKETDE